jgi:hypothetical protein
MGPFLVFYNKMGAIGVWAVPELKLQGQSRKTPAKKPTPYFYFC